MRKLSLKEITPELNGETVLANGWAHETRDFGGLKFLVLRDSGSFLQVTANKKSTEPKLFELMESLTKESVVSVQGKVKKNPKAPKGIELIPEKLELISRAQTPTPVDLSGKISSDQSVRLDWRSIDLRTPKSQAIFRVEHFLVQGAQEFLNENGYTQVFTPCLMGAASESGAEVFKVKYFEREAFLRQDPQLHRQLTIVGGITKLYDVGPSWRAEKSHTTQHLCEHRSWAVEQAFIEDEVELERVQEKMVIAALKKVKQNCKEELELFEVKLRIPGTPFPELRFPKIYDVLEKKGKHLELGEDLDAEAEKILWDHVQKKFKTDFYFFNRFPFKAKPFYVMRVDEEPEWARSIDLNYKGAEMSSGGQREHRHEKIIEQAKLKGMNLKDLEWFTKFFRYGAPSHGGFALGIERLTMQLLNLENIRDAALFPRAPERLLP